jgi:glycosyltransferase involved in cell wall biosynthesis
MRDPSETGGTSVPSSREEKPHDFSPASASSVSEPLESRSALQEALYTVSVQKRELERLAQIERSPWWKVYEAFHRFRKRHPTTDSAVRSLARLLFPRYRKTAVITAAGTKDAIPQGSFRPVVFVSDLRIPEYDRNAGARCTFQYLQLMIEEGMAVFFHARDGQNREPYATRLRAMGVILLGSNVRTWLQKNIERVSHFYVHRPSGIDIMQWIVRMKNPAARVVYFAHDLHRVRLRREFHVTRDPALLKEAALVEFKERTCFELADVIQVVGHVEQAIVSGEYPTKPVLEIPLFYFSPVRQAPVGPRRDLLFVGGFGHHPNRDAMDWFLRDVWPLVRDEMPDLRLHVVGGSTPEDFAARVPGVSCHGWLDDEALSALYRRCRAMIVPLRFGAGVKGKVLEAMAHGLPVLSTEVGVEGLSAGERLCVMIDEAPASWVAAIRELQEDPRRFEAAAERAFDWITVRNSREAAVTALRSSFGLP